ncbi:MAG: BLUF domain-containing protein [Opitutaceae bacterium]
MIQVAYVSSAVPVFTPDDIAGILIKSRHNNTERGITGLLLYRGGDIMQVLEGEEGVIRKLLRAIQEDRRHRGVIKLFEKKIEERDFQDWSMGFHDLNAEGATYLEGYSEFLSPDFRFAQMKESTALKILKSFKARLR